MDCYNKRNQSYKLRCPYDPHAPLLNDYNAGDLVCSVCGLVVGDRVIDVHQEWRMFHNDEKSEQRSRVGDPEISLLGNNNLYTSLSFPKNFNQKVRTALINSPLTFSYAGHRTLLPAFRAISDMAERVNAPSYVSDRACEIYKQVHDLKRHSYYSNFTRAASCLYIACRQESTPRTLREICAAATVDRKELGRCYMLILKMLGISPGGVDGSDYMNRFCAFLGLDEIVKKAAVHISEKTVELEICSGRSPISIAAAAILMACKIADLNITQKRISEVAGITYVTVSGCFKLMVPHVEELLPRNTKFPTPTGEVLERLLSKKVVCEDKPYETLAKLQAKFSASYSDSVTKLLAKNRILTQIYGKDLTSNPRKVPKTNLDRLIERYNKEYGSTERNTNDIFKKPYNVQNLKPQNSKFSSLYGDQFDKLLTKTKMQSDTNDKGLAKPSTTFQKQYTEHLAKVLKQKADPVQKYYIKLSSETLQHIKLAGKKFGTEVLFDGKLVKPVSIYTKPCNDVALTKAELSKDWNTDVKPLCKDSNYKLPYANIFAKMGSKQISAMNQKNADLISRRDEILKRRANEVITLCFKKPYKEEKHDDELKPQSNNIITTYDKQISNLTANEIIEHPIIHNKQQYKVLGMNDLTKGQYGEKLMPQSSSFLNVHNKKPELKDVGNGQYDGMLAPQSNRYISQTDQNYKLIEPEKLIREKYDETKVHCEQYIKANSDEQHKIPVLKNMTDRKFDDTLIPQCRINIKTPNDQQQKNLSEGKYKLLIQQYDGNKQTQNAQQYKISEQKNIAGNKYGDKLVLQCDGYINPQGNAQQKMPELKDLSEKLIPQCNPISKTRNDQQVIEGQKVKTLISQCGKYVIIRNGQQYKISSLKNSTASVKNLGHQQYKIPELKEKYNNSFKPPSVEYTKMNSNQENNILKLKNFITEKYGNNVVPKFGGNRKTDQQHELTGLNNINQHKCDDKLIPQCSEHINILEIQHNQEHKEPELRKLADVKLIPQSEQNTNAHNNQQHKMLKPNVDELQNDKNLLSQCNKSIIIQTAQPSKIPETNDFNGNEYGMNFNPQSREHIKSDIQQQNKTPKLKNMVDKNFDENLITQGNDQQPKTTELTGLNLEKFDDKLITQNGSYTKILSEQQTVTNKLTEEKFDEKLMTQFNEYKNIRKDQQKIPKLKELVKRKYGGKTIPQYGIYTHNFPQHKITKLKNMIDRKNDENSLTQSDEHVKSHCVENLKLKKVAEELMKSINRKNNMDSKSQCNGYIKNHANEQHKIPELKNLSVGKNELIPQCKVHKTAELKNVIDEQNVNKWVKTTNGTQDEELNSQVRKYLKSLGVESKQILQPQHLTEVKYDENLITQCGENTKTNYEQEQNTPVLQVVNKEGTILPDYDVGLVNLVQKKVD